MDGGREPPYPVGDSPNQPQREPTEGGNPLSQSSLSAAENIIIEYYEAGSLQEDNGNIALGNNEANSSQERSPHRHPAMNVVVRVVRNAAVEAAVSNIRGNNESNNTQNDAESANVVQNDLLVPQMQPANDDSVIVVENNQGDDVQMVNVVQPLHTEMPPPVNEPPRTPSSTKKRKRSKSKTPLKTAIACDDDNDDGTICPICLDEWEMSGPHRLTSLKCGHLFGNSCIKRWLQECVPGTRCCPSCKTRAQMRDMRFIYAKRICAVDKTEEYRLKELLASEKTKYTQLNADYGVLKLELSMTKSQVSKLESEIERLKRSGSSNSGTNSAHTTRNYRLFVEKNVEISKEAGCRVMLYARQTKNLIVSQKSNQSLFPGYGVRFIDVEDFRPLNFLHMSNKSIRDLCLNSNEDFLLSATQERSAKLFNVHNRTIVSVFTPSDKPLWSCALDQDLNKFLYLGSQNGTTYIYDVRQPSTFVEEFKIESDLSPVINICIVPYTDTFQYGGFLVCKLQSVWFYEYIAPHNLVPTKLNVEGPFISMSYDSSSNHVLISTRPSTKYSTTRYIFAKLIKLNNVTVLDVPTTFTGSKVAAVMSRCSQIVMNDTTLIAAYLQDVKLLSVWHSERMSRIQSLSVSEIVYDTCPIVNGNETYLAALSECKCRFYKVISTEKS